MKIVFLCNNFKSLNGVERAWSQKLSLLAEYPGDDVYLITYNQYGAPLSFSISDKVHHIDLASRYISRCSFHGIYQYIDRYRSERSFRNELNQTLEKLNPDIVVCADMHVADLKAVLLSTVHATRIVECHCGKAGYFEDTSSVMVSVARKTVLCSNSCATLCRPMASPASALTSTVMARARASSRT